MPPQDEFEAHVARTRLLFSNRHEFAHLEFEHDCAVAFEDMCGVPSIMKVYRKLYMHDVFLLRNAIRVAVDVVLSYVSGSIRRHRRTSATRGSG